MLGFSPSNICDDRIKEKRWQILIGTATSRAVSDLDFNIQYQFPVRAIIFLQF